MSQPDKHVLDDLPRKIVRLNYCDGKIEPAQFCAGDNLKTARALRLSFDGGTSLVVHPSSIMAMC